jgi:diguanylate cyclase (GGDEF)-like protein
MSRDPDPAGPGQIVGVARDISDRKHFENELLEARDAAERAASEARLMADTDDLTRLASRRLFMAQLAGETATAKAAGTPLSVAVFDVDLFKQVNDRFGHAVGDDVLREVASTAVRTVRGQDLVGRIGGEEFAILMPNATEEAAAAVGERLRIAIERCSERVGLPSVTVSIGIAAHRPGDDDGTLLGAADTALYAAKAAGRNRLCTASDAVRA